MVGSGGDHHPRKKGGWGGGDEGERAGAPSLTSPRPPTTGKRGFPGGPGQMEDEGQREQAGGWAERLACSGRGRAGPGSRLDPEWSQDGRTGLRPRGHPGVAACEGASWGGGPPAPASAEAQRLWPGGQAGSPPASASASASPPPELVPLVPLSVLVLLGSWVLQVRDIGKVILFRKP